jgi:eukaryotic-like serine/threonine-protein kinase
VSENFHRKVFPPDKPNMNSILKNSLLIGTILHDKWVILEFIGKGGMGEVYRAHQLNLKRDVAIKVISREWLESLEDDEEELLSGLQRFRNEMQAMARVRHPNVLSIFDYGSISVKGSKGEVPLEYIAMEFLPGGTLRSTMSEEGFYPEEGLTREWLHDYFLPVLEGLEALHEAGMVHRDIKPENVLLDGKTPKIADFGLARSTFIRPLTQSADMKGTPGYMPPEQFVDFRRTDARGDVYAIGKILYEAVDGKMKADTIPFRKANLRNPDPLFFKRLDSIIQKATEEEKNNRLPSVKALEEEILKVLALDAPASSNAQVGHPDQLVQEPRPGAFSGGRKWIWGGVGVMLLFIGVMIFLVQTGQSPLRRVPSSESGSVQTGQEKEVAPTPGPAKDSKTLHGEDGVTLYLIPGGAITLPAADGTQVPSAVESFYMDETLVTNYQFVAFLNQVLADIRVDEGVVKGRGKIWLFLGVAREGYEPIMYRNGRFHINNPAHADLPVIRVTGYGASAYARFFDRRLPTAREWAYAISKGTPDTTPISTAPVGANEGKASGEGLNQTMTAMMKTMQGETTTTHVHPSGGQTSPFPESVTLSKPNGLGIRGLNGNIGEWGVSTLTSPGVKGENDVEYVVLGGLGNRPGKAAPLPASLIRKPWEAFQEVGFRCVRSGGPAAR